MNNNTEFSFSPKPSMSSSEETLCERPQCTYMKYLEIKCTYENLYEDYEFLLNLRDPTYHVNAKIQLLIEKLTIIYSLLVRISAWYNVPIEVPAPPLVGVEPNPGPTIREVQSDIAIVHELIRDLY